MDGNGRKSVIRVTLQARLSRSVSHRLGTSAMALQDTFRIDCPNPARNYGSSFTT